MKRKWILLLSLITALISNGTFAAHQPKTQYVENNNGIASFDVSMRIDATGQRLIGKHLKGGPINFTDHLTMLSSNIGYETGQFKLSAVTSKKNKPLLKTSIKYQAIKLIDPVGIGNFTIKIGYATRHLDAINVDQFATKNGSYHWQVPIFSATRERGTVHNHTDNTQFMEVGSSGGPSTQNDIYTRAFTLYTQGHNKLPIIGHPIGSARSEDILTAPMHSTYACHADGIWGNKADPYRTMKGKCNGSTIAFPAAPNMDYVYGSFVFPTIYTPWTGPKTSHCIVKGKKTPHCVNASIASNIHYIAQKIRIPLSKQVTLYAESGSVYRRMWPNNLRYTCSTNYYARKVVPKSHCLKKSFLSGGTPDPYFAVGYVFKTKQGKTYDAKYIYIPVVENSTGFAWRDASDTEIYAVSASGKPLSENNKKQLRHYLNIGLKTIEKNPKLYQVLGKYFFKPILIKNNLLKK